MTNDNGLSYLLPGILIVLPLVPALLLAVVRGQAMRSAVVWTGALAVAAGSVWLAAGHLSGPPLALAFDLPWLDRAVAGAGLLVSLYMLFACRGIVKREWWIPVLIVAQTVVMVLVEVAGPRAERPIVIDQLSLVMALIIGIVGGLICIYALTYMEDYHRHHPEVSDRKPLFFFLLFAFLSAMFGIVFSNHLGWMHCCWEVTTLCSFLLIGYSRTEEARRNAFRAMGFNAVGGLSFGVAIWWQLHNGRAIELDSMAAMGSAALVPAVLIGFAGLTKSAQLPFSSWLLGAMVAPTPVSALLHSSTMVKAGVFAVLKFAPVFHGHTAGYLIALVGGATFLATSLAAISMSNAKLVLAYSTIANLGLVVACAGVGSPEAVWAGMMLIIFHAISKGLLFLAVGAVEHRTGSRDIEDMEGLLATRRALGIVMIVGIIGMFLAPFGMLVAKWTCLKAFVEVNPLLAILLAYGSAPTLFFWTKWLGKVISVPGAARPAVGPLSANEWAAVGTLAVLTVCACVLFPLVSDYAVAPYLARQYAGAMVAPAGVGIMALMLGLLVLAIMAFIFYPPRGQVSARYLAGANMGAAGNTFRGPLGEVTPASRNYYLMGFFPEGKIILGGSLASIALMIVALAAVLR
ncbi:MAG: proton-conducting transporter membrane subunit [Candidatus Coatesbacteria bacterium]